MLKIGWSLLVITPFFALGATSLFNTDDCKFYLETVSDVYIAIYKQEALIKGAKNESEISEYVERKKRIAFLENKERKVQEEFEAGEATFYNMTGFLISKNKKKLSKKSQEKLKKVFTKAGDQWVRDPSEKTIREQFPTLFSLLESKTPISAIEARTILNILELKAALYISNTEISKSLLNLPLSSKISKVPKQALYKAVRKGQDRYRDLLTKEEGITKDAIDAPYENLFESIINPKESTEMIQGKVNSHYALIDILLKSKKIPKNIKEEIRLQVDFDSKIGQERWLNPLLDQYSKEVAKYFEIPLP